MNETVETIFGLIGGLALFLYGMNNMSDALQKTAGDSMKKVLGILTRNAVTGAIAGALVTAVLQSSSATTVMVIGFVSAGLMTLPQGISVIFGANIGTTMTAQLMAFKISNYIYPIIFIGFLINFIAKKERTKNIGTVLFSFGLLFEGIEIMGSVMKPLASSAFFINLMGKVTDVPVLGVLLGAVMTLVVQSSSATIAVLQNFASQAAADGVTSVMGLAGALPILLGDNIGTTITALLASIGQSKDARRTAIAHSIFNISGSVLFLFLLQPFAAVVRMISPTGNEVDIISRQIANAHTLFNVVVTLIWLPLLPVMVKIVNFLIKGDDRSAVINSAPKYLDDRVIAQPLAAMYLVSEEIIRLSDFTKNMIANLKSMLSSNRSSEAESSYHESYQTVKSLQDSISVYITKLFSSGNLTEDQSEQTAGLLVVANNIERIADRCEDISATDSKIRLDGLKMTDKAFAEITGCLDITDDLFTNAMESVETGDTAKAEEVIKGRQKMKNVQRKNNKAHLNRVKKKQCDAALTAPYSGIMYNLERATDNCAGIAEEVLDSLTLVKLDEDELKKLDEVKADEK